MVLGLGLVFPWLQVAQAWQRAQPQGRGRGRPVRLQLTGASVHLSLWDPRRHPQYCPSLRQSSGVHGNVRWRVDMMSAPSWYGPQGAGSLRTAQAGRTSLPCTPDPTLNRPNAKGQTEFILARWGQAAAVQPGTRQAIRRHPRMHAHAPCCKTTILVCTLVGAANATKVCLHTQQEAATSKHGPAADGCCRGPRKILHKRLTLDAAHLHKASIQLGEVCNVVGVSLPDFCCRHTQRLGHVINCVA